MLLFFWLGGLCAGTSGNRTRPRRSRGAGQEKTECIEVNDELLSYAMAKTDTIPQLGMFKGQCKPIWLFMASGKFDLLTKLYMIL